ncbi:hypothetical protein NDU88_004512 [Pleurodeles waltl]|uniref:Uncharacterized protein n=1 Tax=Pleurodeles waltl TaxID=8319 RepID=A0AAV7WUI8_PLEWA|nr:hypothetical protein NDU88_004512 [Pleurodeles waltl]
MSSVARLPPLTPKWHQALAHQVRGKPIPQRQQKVAVRSPAGIRGMVIDRASCSEDAGKVKRNGRIGGQVTSSCTTTKKQQKEAALRLKEDPLGTALYKKFDRFVELSARGLLEAVGTNTDMHLHLFTAEEGIIGAVPWCSVYVLISPLPKLQILDGGHAASKQLKPYRQPCVQRAVTRYVTRSGTRQK